MSADQTTTEVITAQTDKDWDDYVNYMADHNPPMLPTVIKVSPEVFDRFLAMVSDDTVKKMPRLERLLSRPSVFDDDKLDTPDPAPNLEALARQPRLFAPID